jgi:acyl carrier protein
MNRPPLDPAAVRQAVLATLHRMAPEVAPGDLDPAAPLRDQVDLGSMDWTNLLAALEESLGVDIPEARRAKLVTLDDLVAYLQDRVQAAANRPGSAAPKRPR